MLMSIVDVDVDVEDKIIIQAYFADHMICLPLVIVIWTGFRRRHSFFSLLYAIY